MMMGNHTLTSAFTMRHSHFNSSHFGDPKKALVM